MITREALSDVGDLAIGAVVTASAPFASSKDSRIGPLTQDLGRLYSLIGGSRTNLVSPEALVEMRGKLDPEFRNRVIALMAGFPPVRIQPNPVAAHVDALLNIGATVRSELLQ